MINYFLYAIILIEFIIILFILNRNKKEKSNLSNIAIKLLTDSDVEKKEFSKIDKKNNLQYYILKSVMYYKNQEYEKSFNILITLFAKKRLDKDLKNAIVYLIVKNLTSLKRYKEALNYIKKNASIFSKKNSNLDKLYGEVLIINNDFSGFKILEKYFPKNEIIEKALEIFEYSSNYQILEFLIKKKDYNDKVVEYFLNYLIEKSENKKIEELIFSLKDFVPRNNTVKLIYKWIKTLKYPENMYKRIEKSNLHIVYKSILKILVNYCNENDNIEFKIILEQLRKNNEYMKYRDIIVFTLILIKQYEYIPLFSGGEN